jgi:hypothetical protein
MQLGIEVEPRRAAYRIDETVKLRLHLRNAGTESISTTLPRLEVLEKFGLDLVLHCRGKPVPWSWGQAHKPRELFTVSGGIELPLRPGATHELPSAEIVIGKEAASNSTMAILEVPANETFRLSCSLKTYGYAQGEGEPLASGVLEFRVEAAERTAVVETPELDRLVELAEQELRRVQQLVQKNAAAATEVNNAEIKLADIRIRRAHARQDLADVVSLWRRVVELRDADRDRITKLLRARAASATDQADAEARALEARLKLKAAEALLEASRRNPTASPPAAPAKPE